VVILAELDEGADDEVKPKETPRVILAVVLQSSFSIPVENTDCRYRVLRRLGDEQNFLEMIQNS
jgi:hypothetical protein